MSAEMRTLVEVLREHAQRQPECVSNVFLRDGEEDQTETIRYGELDRRAMAVAARLQSLAVPGQRALLLLPAGVEYVVAFLACLYAGIVAVPAYPPRNARNLPRVRAIVEDSQAVLLLTTASEEQRLRPMVVEIDGMQALNWVAVDAVPSSDHAAWRMPDIGDDGLAFLQYTSGSTGQPKGVMVSHANLAHNLKYIQRTFEVVPGSVNMSWLPPYHDMGLIGGILEPLYSGIVTHMMSPASFLQRPLRWLQLVSRERVTHTGGPDFAYDLCVRRIAPEQCEGLDLSSWKVAYNGAEPVRAATLERFHAAFSRCGFLRDSFRPCYGMAEATLLVTVRPGMRTFDADPAAMEQGRIVAAAESASASPARTLVSSGIIDESVAVADPATGQRCADGRVGEIWVRNGSVAQGYWQRPELTAEAFAARLADGDGPWMRTGDLGAALDGELYVTGRIKDLVILAGRNLYPTDIEALVQESDEALRPGFCVAFGIERDGQERLVVLQELDFRRKVDAVDVGQRIAGRIGAMFDVVPYTVRLLKAGTLPVTTSGKLRRRDARAMFLAGEFDEAPGLMPVAVETGQASASVRDWLAQRIATRLRVPEASVDIDRPFVEFGFGSVEAVETSAALEDWLGRSLPPTLLWDYPSIRKLAQHLQPDAVAAPDAPRTAPQGDRIAIVGMACRFPGAADKPAFWSMLREGVDAVTEVPAERWDAAALYAEEPGVRGKACTRWGGFVDGIDRFDAAFFGIDDDEACEMDPQQRMLLQTAWHALEDAAIPADALAGSATGVYIGIGSNDFGRRLAGRPEALTAAAGTGNALSIAANRISYQFGLLGPSMAVDTACSASLVSVHLACQALRCGEVDLALAGGVNAMLNPDMSVIFSQAGMMAADGRCKTFDARADGYVRGEGCGVVVLKRLDDALRDGDPVQAVIAGSAVNQSGRSNGLTAPSRVAQVAVVRRALAQAGIEPAQLGYIEAHGTGTALGDPIEIQGLAEVLREGTRTAPCAVGSVKTNIGHLEAAAGIAGLIKTALMVRYGEIAPHLHLQTLNPRLRRAGLPLTVPTRCEPWQGEGALGRVAGVSSFGFGGSNAHVVLHQAPSREDVADSAPLLLVLSARSEAALRALAARWSVELRSLSADEAAEACHIARTGRSALPERLAVWGADAPALQQALDAFLRDDAGACWCRGSATSKPPVVRLLAAARVSAEAATENREAHRRIAAAFELAPPVDEAPSDAVASALSEAMRSLWRRWGVALSSEEAPEADHVLTLETEGAALPDASAVLGQVARLWAAGAGLDWHAFANGRPRRALNLPLYPFQSMLS